MWTRTFLILISIFILSGCYQVLDLEGFDKIEWKQSQSNCSDYRLNIAQHLIDHKDVLLNCTQNEIKSLLSTPEEHELYERNQKFFHYRLSPPSSCQQDKVLTYLSIRFNAMGRSNNIQIVKRDANTK